MPHQGGVGDLPGDLVSIGTRDLPRAKRLGNKTASHTVLLKNKVSKVNFSFKKKPTVLLSIILVTIYMFII